MNLYLPVIEYCNADDNSINVAWDLKVYYRHVCYAISFAIVISTFPSLLIDTVLKTLVTKLLRIHLLAFISERYNESIYSNFKIIDIDREY